MADIISPQRIHKLPPALANQIAAGEVVERPAAVVKELLENSLDAGATEIRLNISKAGRLLIDIEDNGGGIHAEDLPLALHQHATSKLITEADLGRINTLGFRGEALSSIASVAKLELSSRIATDDHGWLIQATEAHPPQPIAMLPGTRIQIRDLFANTPARRKFLRTDNTEFFHIREIVKRLALSRYDVSFHLRHNGKNILQCPLQNNGASERMRMIFGQSFLDKALELDCERSGLRLWGWFGSPEIARNQLDQQYFYLNRRMIRDKQVNHAVRMATQDYLYTGKHAVYVLFLEIDPAAVDVNVHPAKQEVRFRQARDIHDFILSALRQLFANPNTTALSNVGENAPPDTRDSNTPSPAYKQQSLNQLSHPSVGQIAVKASSQYAYHRSTNIPAKAKQSIHKLYSATNDLLLIADRYLIAQVNSETFLLDIFLCNEIITCSKLEHDLAGSGICRRPLLVPLTIKMTAEQADFFTTNSASFETFGLKLEQIATDSILVREVPLPLEYADINSLIDDMEVMIKAHKSNEAIILMISKHTNDAGLLKINNDTAPQIMNTINNIHSPLTEKSKCHAWKIIDATTLNTFLNKR